MDKLSIIDALSNDIYSIVDYGGKKQIHFWGYLYDAGDSITENPKQTYRNVEFTGFTMDINEFIQLKKNDDFIDIISDMSCEVKQYIKDLTEEEAQNTLDNYFGDIVFPVDEPHAPTPLLLSEVTMDTPCGDYINL